MNEIHYFELFFPNDYSMVIQGIRQPTIEEADYFVESDRLKLGLGNVMDVEEVSKWEAKTFFDSVEGKPVFGRDQRIDPEKYRGNADVAYVAQQMNIRTVQGDNPMKNEMPETFVKEVRDCMDRLAVDSPIVSENYRTAIFDAIENKVAEDVWDTADREDWNDDDVRLAIARTIMAGMGIEQ